jgi:uncharacterized membrane protein YhaH (DUF805 family)
MMRQEETHNETIEVIKRSGLSQMKSAFLLGLFALGISALIIFLIAIMIRFTSIMHPSITLILIPVLLILVSPIFLLSASRGLRGLGSAGLIAVNGKAPRKEIVLITLGSIIILLLQTIALRFSEMLLFLQAEVLIIPLLIFTLIILIPIYFTAAIRRLHDIGYRGVWILLCLIPCITPLFVFFLFIYPGKPN